jgi:predicted nucleotidyltransferase component of viral defense system
MRYATANAFRTALETRLRTRASETGRPFPQLRNEIAYNRLLARLLLVAPDRWVLKGAVALDLRLGVAARLTKDMDLGREDDIAAASADMKAAEAEDLGDFFSFVIMQTKKLDGLESATAVRYKVHASLASRTFVDITVDVGFNRHVGWVPESLPAPDVLGFAGIEAIDVPVLPLAQHVAEKLHAYTRSYKDGTVQSSRVKDLVDLVLIARHSSLNAATMRAALEGVFEARDMQTLPPYFPSPPEGWRQPYEKAAIAVSIDPGLLAAHSLVSAFLDPLLSPDPPLDATWDPVQQRWLAPDDLEGHGVGQR